MATRRACLYYSTGMSGAAKILVFVFSRTGFWLFTGVVILAGLGGWLGARPAYHAYRDWRSMQLANKAERYLAANDLRAATLSTQQALQFSPVSAPANRIKAVINTRMGDPNALIYWQNAVRLAPANLTYKLEHAQATLRFGQPAAALDILEQIKAKMGHTLGWLIAASGCAMARADFDAAIGYLRSLRELEPQNEQHQLNYASAALFSLNPALQFEALTLLEALALKPAFAPKALRNLAFYFRRIGDLKTCLNYWNRIQQRDSLTWQEKIYCLELVGQIEPTRKPALLAQYQNEAQQEKSPKGVYELAGWYFRGSHSLDCVDLLTAANVDLREPAFHFLMADALIDLKDWDQLEILFRNPIVHYREYLRYALLALSEQRRGRVQSQTALWDEAVRLAEGQVSRLVLLANVAVQWGWDYRAIEIWWRISRGQETPEVGFSNLFQYYIAKKDKRNLRLVLEALRVRFPEDLGVANDLADLDMLFHQNLPRAYSLAEWVYKQDPQQSAFAATYGLALLCQGRFEEAEKIYAGIANTLNLPGVKLNYAMILTATGKAGQAKTVLAAIDPKLLEPEEIHWFDKTRQQAEDFSQFPLQLRWVRLNNQLQQFRQILLCLKGVLKTLAGYQEDVLPHARLAASGRSEPSQFRAQIGISAPDRFQSLLTT